MSRRVLLTIPEPSYELFKAVADARHQTLSACLAQMALDTNVLIKQRAAKLAQTSPKPPKPKSMQQRKREVDAFMKSARGQLWVECGAVANYTNIWRDYDIRTGDVRLSDRDKFLDHVERVGIKAWREAHLAGDLFDPTVHRITTLQEYIT